MTNELERLRAAHDQIPDPDPAVIDAVLRQLRSAAAREAASRRVRRRRLRRLAVVTAAGLALVALTTDLGRRGAPRIDAVAQARAALAAPGEIVHYTVALSAGRRDACYPGPLEVWRASSPTRWRAVQPVTDDPSCGTMDLSQGYGPVVAPRLEVAYAAGQTSSYVPGRDLMLVIVDRKAKNGERRAPSSAAGAASLQLMSSTPRRSPPVGRAPDPVSDAERLLATGALRDAGEAVRDGRRVRVLTGGWRRGGVERTTIEYVVDATSFAPVAVTSTTRFEGRSATVHAAFADYERIPLTRASARLLRITPERRPRVVELTIRDIKNPS